MDAVSGRVRSQQPSTVSRPGAESGTVEAGAVEDARSAGLRYLADDGPGITRRRTGRGFTYVGPDGKRIKDHLTLARIRKLAVPPAWTSVWISPFDNTHLAATGRDAKNRKQYRYHADFVAIRDATKYEHLTTFARSLPMIRRKTARHRALRGLPREKVLAAVVALLEETGIRIGNEEYAKDNGSFGLTTLRNKHARVKGAEILFSFHGKSGKEWRVPLHDRRVAKIIRTCQELPGQRLFEYLDAEGTPQEISSSDVNAYLREISGKDITAKDFRTWTATVQAAVAFDAIAREGATPSKKLIKEVMAKVSQKLGNTIAICRKCYVHPRVVTAFSDGKLTLNFSANVSRRSVACLERAVLAFLDDTP